MYEKNYNCILGRREKSKESSRNRTVVTEYLEELRRSAWALFAFKRKD